MSQTPPVMQEAIPLPESMENVPKEQAKRKEGRETEEHYLEVVEETVDPEKVDIEEMGARAEQWAERMEKAEEKQKAVHHPPTLPPEQETTSPGVEQPPRARKPPIPRQTRGGTPGRGRGGRGGNSARAAAMTAALAHATRKEQDIKTFTEKEGEGETEQRLKAEGENKETEDATSPEKPLGDEGFPSVGIPEPSDRYKELSVFSSQNEGYRSDVQDLSVHIKNLTMIVQEQNTKIAAMQAEIDAIKTDKSKFLSDVMADIRALKRQHPHDPPVTTPASSTVVTQTKTEQNQPVEDYATALAQFRARRRR